MENHPRYQIGQREENGRYAVTVEGTYAGYIYRRHGSWYAVMPGLGEEFRLPNRYQARDHVGVLFDSGHRPGTEKAPASPFGIKTNGTFMPPELAFTLANVVRASEAMARLAELGWTPLRGYPGADQPWRMECDFCGWQGFRFWSHLRGRNGDGIPRPISRHPGCLPAADRSKKIEALAAARKFVCTCDFWHPTTLWECQDTLKALQAARKEYETLTTKMYLREILEECPAASIRAASLREALKLMKQKD
ncbi:hypothetical protein QR97_39795 [Streptomyces sp. PBH53]|uniref:hypothetical protein n=1 Tax=Streptomyces sp. PBH53 TaxID=1577075 RepID=UPI0006563C4E|nr:hypothetical protein [Streptomyces sp. PBH53]AKN75019.1 hypothetical protein QR97_39795 [Streptomyces sp. PBH53]